MKKYFDISSVLRSLLAAILLTVNFPLSAEETAQPAPKNPDGTTLTPAELLLAEIKATPYSEREALRTKLKDAEARFAEKIPDWEAKKNELPEKQKKAAEENFKQLVQLREVLRQKIDGVENAAVETWDSAKHELYVALLNAIDAHKKLKAQFDR